MSIYLFAQTMPDRVFGTNQENPVKLGTKIKF